MVNEIKKSKHGKKKFVLALLAIIFVCIFIDNYMSHKIQFSDTSYYKSRRGDIYWKSNELFGDTYKKLSNINHKRFTLLRSNGKICGGTDGNVVVIRDTTLIDSDPETFECFYTVGRAKDINHYYCFHERPGPARVIKELEKGNLELITPFDNQDFYAKDENNIYYSRFCELRPLKDVDLSTFQVIDEINRKFSYDKNNVYYRGIIIPNSNPRDFTLGYGDYEYIDSNQSLTNGELWDLWESEAHPQEYQ